jgi:hypothetical protein
LISFTCLLSAGDTTQKGSNLSPEVCCSYECSQDVLQKDISEGRCIVLNSDVLARLGLKATALAWLSMAWAFKICRLGQSHQ